MIRYILNTLLAAACTYAAAVLAEERRYYLLLVPVALIALQSWVNLWLLAKESKSLRLLLRLLHDELRFTVDEEVRITLLRPGHVTKRFTQVARYSLFQPELTNHMFHIDKGVAGLARRNKRPEFMTIDGNFHKKIRELLGFTEQESRAFTQKAEYFCVPVFSEDREVKYVLCVDSINHGTITDARQTRLLQLMPHVAPLLVKTYEEEAENRIRRAYL